MEILISKIEYKNIELNEGDMYIIHKPDDINEMPTWISSMDVFDGMVIKLAYSNGETSTRRYWIARPVSDNYIDTICSFNMNWLEPIGRIEELESSYVDFFDI